MYDTITCDNPRFEVGINSLKPGDEVEVGWSFYGHTATAQGLLWEEAPGHLYLAHSLVRGSFGCAPALTSIRIIKRAEPEWAKAKVVAVGRVGYLYYRRDDGSYSTTLHGLASRSNTEALADTYNELITVVVDADGNWVWDEPELDQPSKP